MGMTEVMISFIIPVHNAGLTLQRCVKSIADDIMSTGASHEIILIENGSTDQSYEIAKNLEQLYKNVKIMRSEKGVSRARNTGIRAATGKKLIFLDADDLWIQGSAKAVGKQIADQNVDLAVYSYRKDDSAVIHNYDVLNHVVTGEAINDCRAWMISRPTLRMQVWAKVFDRNVVVGNEIWFDENLRYSEDSEFIIRYSHACKSIMIMDTPIYRYCSDTASAMRSFDRMRMNEYMKSLSISRDYIKHDVPCIQKAFLEYVLIHMNIIFVHDVFDMSVRDSFGKKLRWMREIIQKELFGNALKEVPIGKCFTIQLFPELFIKCRLFVAAGMICRTKVFLNQRKYRRSALKRLPCQGEII